MDGSEFPLRGSDRFCARWDGDGSFSSTDDDLRDAMAWHTPWRGVACRGVAWHGMPCHDHTQSKIRDRPKQTRLSHLASPHTTLDLAWGGFPKGFPIASPTLPPYPVNHISILPFPRSYPPPRPLFPRQPFVSCRATDSSWGYPSPPLSKLHGHLVTTLSISALSISSSLVSLCDQTPPHSSSPGSSTRTAPPLVPSPVP